MKITKVKNPVSTKPMPSTPDPPPPGKVGFAGPGVNIAPAKVTKSYKKGK